MNKSEMVDGAELPFDHESNHSVPSNQPNEQAKKDDVVIDLQAMIENNEEGLLSPTCCIYRVPYVIRKLNPYTPKFISIGPFHHGILRLQNMEGQKQIYFKRFINRTETSLDDLVNFARHSAPKVRNCYSESIKLSNDFVKMILVDASFIIELFRSSYVGPGGSRSDAKVSKPRLAELVIMDLILLENQLPFFFLEELFNRAFPSGDHALSFRQLTYDFFIDFNIQRLEVNNDSRIKNFTDLLRLFHLPSWESKRKFFSDEGSNFLQYSVSKLQEAGLKFKISKSKCLLDLDFSGHVLEIPQVMVDDKFETLLHNMIALKQYHYPYESYIADYAFILECLINTTKDVDVLIHEKIICNGLDDSKKIVKVCNSVGKNTAHVSFNSNYLHICKRLNEFYKNRWHRMKATLRRDYYETLRRDYCKTPWKTAASIAAVVLLILTLIQTICSVLQVPHVARIFKI